MSQAPQASPTAEHPEAVRTLLRVTGLRGYRNGRLALDYFTRRLRRRLSQVLVQGQWYDRAALAAYARDRRRRGLRVVVPHSGAPLPREVERAVTARAWCC